MGFPESPDLRKCLWNSVLIRSRCGISIDIRVLPTEYFEAQDYRISRKKENKTNFKRSTRNVTYARWRSDFIESLPALETRVKFFEDKSKDELVGISGLNHVPPTYIRWLSYIRWYSGAFSAFFALFAFKFFTL